MKSKINGLVRQFDAQYFEKINLVASENLSSENMRHALSSDINHRYVMPTKAERDPALWEYPNQNILRQIVSETQKVACELFHARHADISPLSGNQVASIMLTCLLQKGDSFLSIGSQDGGHFTTDKLAQTHGYNRFDLPYTNGSLDITKTKQMVRNHKAKMIFLDASMITHPYPLQELRKAVGEDVIISYDASHTMGIIAGEQFQSPLTEGADFLHGSTHKSLFGAQKGIILSVHDKDSSLGQKVFKRITPEFVSNAHPHHIAAVGIALEELRDFGQDYAKNVIKNARLFAMEASRRGIIFENARNSFTNNHQLIARMGNEKKAEVAFRHLEEVNINVNMVTVPHTNGTQHGLRLGFSEITRRNMSEQAVIQLANLFADTIMQSRKANNIRSDVKALSSAHRGIGYTHPQCNAETTSLHAG